MQSQSLSRRTDGSHKVHQCQSASNKFEVFSKKSEYLKISECERMESGVAFLTFSINRQFSVYFYSFLCVWDSILSTWNSFPSVLNRFRLWALYGLTKISEAWGKGDYYNQLSQIWFQCLNPTIVKFYSMKFSTTKILSNL